MQEKWKRGCVAFKRLEIRTHNQKNRQERRMGQSTAPWRPRRLPRMMRPAAALPPHGAHMPAGTTEVDVGSAADEPSRHTKLVRQNRGCTSVSAKSATIVGEPVP